MTPNEIVEGVGAAIDRMNEGREKKVSIVAVSTATLAKLRAVSISLEICVNGARVLWDGSVSDDEVAPLAIGGERQIDWRELPREHFGTRPPPESPLDFERDETLYGAYDPVAGF